MKVNFSTEKQIKGKSVKDLISGTVFSLYNERDADMEDKNYYMVCTRNGHREYFNLMNGSFKALNDDCPVLVVDCALTIYGIID